MFQVPDSDKQPMSKKAVFWSLVILILLFLFGATKISARWIPVITPKEKIASLLASTGKDAQMDGSKVVYLPAVSAPDPAPTPDSAAVPAAGHAVVPVQPDSSIVMQPENAAAGAVWTSLVDSMPWIYIPAGTFIMGANADRYASPAEKPQHEVYTDGYWMDQYPVTNAMYTLCVRAGACRYGISPHIPAFSRYTAGAYANRPVVYITWEEAAAYCAWQGGRLPSEAEWEKASRAPENRTYPWGEYPPAADQANIDNRVGDTTDVNAYPQGRSDYRIFDLGGNVREWVQDWYQDTSFSGSSNPVGPQTGENKVLKGASYQDTFKFSRGSNRQSRLPYSPGMDTGFRCVIP
jgi:formylglycine-generating enzyme required for sulfatase activity